MGDLNWFLNKEEINLEKFNEITEDNTGYEFISKK
jgi:hypothetical protein